jgi:hypothetical protein
MYDCRRSFRLDIGFIELQVITAPSLISTAPAKSFPVCCVFTSRSLVRASNNWDCSASALRSSLHNFLYRTDLVAVIVFLITPRHGQGIQQRSSVARISVATGTCLSSRSRTAAIYSCLLICYVATDAVPLSVSRPLPRNVVSEPFSSSTVLALSKYATIKVIHFERVFGNIWSDPLPLTVCINPTVLSYNY